MRSVRQVEERRSRQTTATDGLDVAGQDGLHVMLVQRFDSAPIRLTIQYAGMEPPIIMGEQAPLVTTTGTRVVATIRIRPRLDSREWSNGELTGFGGQRMSYTRPKTKRRSELRRRVTVHLPHSGVPVATSDPPLNDGFKRAHRSRRLQREFFTNLNGWSSPSALIAIFVPMFRPAASAAIWVRMGRHPPGRNPQPRLQVSRLSSLSLFGRAVHVPTIGWLETV
jgi:hypothetical protein